MDDVLTIAHIVAAVFLLGPIAAAGPVASRALRSRDAGGLHLAERTLRVYGLASLSIPVLGLWLAGEDIGETWIWLSAVLMGVSILAVLLVALPATRDAAADLGTGGTGRAHLGRIWAGVGTASVAYVVVTILMIYQPGR